MRSIRKYAYYALLAVSAALICWSLVTVSRIVRCDGRGEDAYSALQERMDGLLQEGLAAAEGAGWRTSEDGPELFPDAAAFEPLMRAVGELRGEYPDVAGWILIPGTAVDYPVVRSSEQHGHDHWLTHLYNGEENRMGSIFLDRRTPQPGEHDNTIIYGHNLRNGTMFRSLSYYLKEDGYCGEHPYFIVALEDGVLLCRIISVREVSTSSLIYLSDFATETEREAFLSELYSKNGVNTSVEVSDDTRFITLSTCSYGSGGSRMTVVAKVTSLKKIN